MPNNPIIAQAAELWNRKQPQQAFQLLVEHIQTHTLSGSDPAIKQAEEFWKNKRHKEALALLVERVRELSTEPEPEVALPQSGEERQGDSSITNVPPARKGGMNFPALATFGLIICIVLLLIATKSLQVTVEKLENELSAIQTDVSGLEEQASVIQTDMGGLVQQTSVIHTDVEGLKVQASVVRTDVGVIEGEVSGIQTAIGLLDSDMSTAFSNMRTLASAIDYVTPLAENGNRYAHSHTYSDARLKLNVQEISSPLQRVLSLHGVQFEWDTQTYPSMGFENGAQIGFIAQEVEQVFPELVTTDAEGFKTLDYAKLTAVLVEALKEQQTEIQTMQEQITQLQEYEK